MLLHFMFKMMAPVRSAFFISYIFLCSSLVGFRFCGTDLTASSSSLSWARVSVPKSSSRELVRSTSTMEVTFLVLLGHCLKKTTTKCSGSLLDTASYNRRQSAIQTAFGLLVVLIERLQEESRRLNADGRSNLLVYLMVFSSSGLAPYTLVLSSFSQKKPCD